MGVSRVLAWIYTVAAVGIAVWALAVDVIMYNSQREHMLPNLVLMLVGAPTSMLVSMIYEFFLTSLPKGLQGIALSGWVQVPVMLVGPVLQVTGLLWLTRPEKK